MNAQGSYQLPPPPYVSPSSSSSPQRPQDEGWFDWAYKGVDHTLPGNGGPECRDFLSLSQRCWESAMASLIGLLALLYAYPRLRLPVPCPARYRDGEPRGKRILLILMCLTFGIELGFKFSTRQVIWIGNPCHLATMMQIFILAAPPSRIVTAAFRLHMHMLTGAPIAILFPVINTRLLPFETGVYFLQHILMLIIPFYLMNTGDPFIPEDLLDFKWAFTSFGFLYIYHFLPLQFLAYHSQVNLNNMLCPAVSDPFHGKYYRLFAICHQIILIPTLGKVFVIIAKAFRIVPCNDLPDAPISEVFSSNCTKEDCPQEPPAPCCSPKPPSCCSPKPPVCCSPKPPVCCSPALEPPSCCPPVSETGSCCHPKSFSLQDTFIPSRKTPSVHSNDVGSVGRKSCDDYNDSDSGFSASCCCSNNKNRDRVSESYAMSNASSASGALYDNKLSSRPEHVGKCKSSSVHSCNKDLPPNGVDDCRSSHFQNFTRTPTSGADTKGSCFSTPAPPTQASATAVTTPSGKSCGGGDSSLPSYVVTRRLVNGKVVNGDQHHHQQQQQQSQRGTQSKNKSKNEGGDDGGSNSRSRHRSGSGSGSRRSSRHQDDRGQPLSVSELEGRNGHAKAH